MRGPTLDEFSARVESYKPTFVYISGPYSGLVDSIKGAIGAITLQGKEKRCLSSSKSVAESEVQAAQLTPGCKEYPAVCVATGCPARLFHP